MPANKRLAKRHKKLADQQRIATCVLDRSSPIVGKPHPADSAFARIKDRLSSNAIAAKLSAPNQLHPEYAPVTAFSEYCGFMVGYDDLDYAVVHLNGDVTRAVGYVPTADREYGIARARYWIATDNLPV